MHCTGCQSAVPAGTRYCLQCGLQVSDPGAATVMLEDEQDAVISAIRRELASDYAVERELGRGGMAIVFLATDVNLGRRVALKVLPPDIALRRSMADRFKREAKMAASLDHPNIIPIYRVGQAGGLLYIAMKFIDGRGLDEIIDGQGALPITIVLHVLRASARALAYAHERGIVHRDVKSANILIDREGRVVVSDFGIARAIEEPALTATGVVVGTPYFMSPEQCAARPIAPQSDQYSLGVVAFHMLTGCVPFNAETLPGIMHHHFYTAVPDLRASRPDVPSQLAEIVNRLLAKKPEQRYGSTDALCAAIQQIPLSERDRRHAEVLLRDLAIGIPIPAVVAAPLPPLVSSVRFTPEDSGAMSAERPGRARRRARAATAIVAAIALAIVAYRWTGGAAAAAASPEAVAVAGLATERATDSTALPARDDRAPIAAGGAADSPSTAAPTEAPVAGPVPPTAPSPTGKVRVGAYPASAEIFVDGRLLGIGVVVDSVLPAGWRRLRITAPGYAPFDTAFEVRAGETSQISRIGLRPAEDTP